MPVWVLVGISNQAALKILYLNTLTSSYLPFLEFGSFMNIMCSTIAWWDPPCPVQGILTITHQL